MPVDLGYGRDKRIQPLRAREPQGQPFPGGGLLAAVHVHTHDAMLWVQCSTQAAQKRPFCSRRKTGSQNQINP